VNFRERRLAEVQAMKYSEKLSGKYLADVMVA